MTRVTESSNVLALQHSMNKAKHKLEELQLKGSSLKEINKPSDDPASSMDVLAYQSRLSDNSQYIKNADFASLHLKFLEDSVEEITNILVRVKEIAIGQASDLYDSNIRSGVARELVELRNQALGIANRRFGNRYIFGGHSTLRKPFDRDGHYHGDTGKITVEVSKDSFVPINMTGLEVFYSNDGSKDNRPNPLKPFAPKPPEKTNDPQIPDDRSLDLKVDDKGASRSLASVDETAEEKKGWEEVKDLNTDLKDFKKRDNIFGQITTLASAMEVNDTDLIQNMLEKFDDSIDRMVTLRTKVGALSQSVDKAKGSLESENLVIAEHKSKLGDADVAEIFVDLNKQQQVLKATYKSGQQMINTNLLDFIN